MSSNTAKWKKGKWLTFTTLGLSISVVSVMWWTSRKHWNNKVMQQGWYSLGMMIGHINHSKCKVTERSRTSTMGRQDGKKEKN